MASEVNKLLEGILEETGGMGRFQFITITLINLCKVPITWSVLMMMFGGATPDWWCGGSRNSSLVSMDEYTDADNETMVTSSFKVCNMNGSLDCTFKVFDSDMNTIISEVTKFYLKKKCMVLVNIQKQNFAARQT